MGKCNSCANGNCGGKYELRRHCDDPRSCTCKCGEKQETSIWKTGLSILGGAATVVGGVALTVATGGAAAVVGGGVLVGAGSSMISNPVTKMLSGERMTTGDYVTDLAVGGTIGVVTGGIGSGVAAKVAAKGLTGAAKVGASIGAGALSGAVGGGISEGGRALKGEEVTADSVEKSLLMGAALGGLGGATSKMAGAAAKKINIPLGRTVTHATLSAAADAGVQYLETGEVDKAKLVANTTTHVLTNGCTHLGEKIGTKTSWHQRRVNKDLLKRDLEENSSKDKAERKQIEKHMEKAIKTANNEEYRSTIEKQGENIEKRNQLNLRRKELNEAKNPPNGKGKSYYKRIKREKVQVDKELGQTKRLIDKDNHNFHMLDGDKTGQAAIDASAASDKRGRERIVLDRNKNGKLVYSGYTEHHDYKETNKPGHLRKAPKYNKWKDHPIPARAPNSKKEKRKKKKESE